MFNILIIAGKSQNIAGLRSELGRDGFALVVDSGEETTGQITGQPLDLVLIDSDNHQRIKELTEMIKLEKNLPVLALVRQGTMESINDNLDAVDDFITKPYDPQELVLRIKRLLHKSGHTDSELINCGDLKINLARCEVTLSGRFIMLTFMEYELLRFLAGNKGRVFTRDVLLNKVWGYDYYGGDRTVDVHVRRLRSKIEDSSHTFIETVRNIGYRFLDDT